MEARHTESGDLMLIRGDSVKVFKILHKITILLYAILLI